MIFFARWNQLLFCRKQEGFRGIYTVKTGRKRFPDSGKQANGLIESFIRPARNRQTARMLTSFHSNETFNRGK